MAAEWHRPTGYESGPWVNESYAYDGDMGTHAYRSVNQYEWTGWLTLTHEGLSSTQARFYVSLQDPLNSVKVEVYKDDAWEQVYSGGIWTGWKTFTYDEGLVTKIQINVKTSSYFKNETARVYECQIYGESPPSDTAAPYSFIM